MTEETRSRLRALIDERRRELVHAAADRCLDAASQSRYRAGCRCEDCRAIATRNRWERRYGTPEAAERTRAYERARWAKRKAAA